MLLRILTGVVGGVLLLVALQYSFFSALAICALLNALALYEHSRLDPRLSSNALALFILAATALLTLTSMALVHNFAPELALPLAALLVLACYACDVLAFHRGQVPGQGAAGLRASGLGAFWARAVLLITVPLACVPAVAWWPHHFPYLLLLLGASFGADIGAMAAGKLAGRHKLSPRLSPYKTWEGLLGGVLAGGACWMVTVALWPPEAQFGSVQFADLPASAQLLLASGAGMACALFGIAGGLLFSMLKRQAGVKDYGALLPGHGGVLDRFDALLFCAPVVYLICLL